MKNFKEYRRRRIHNRVRKKISGTPERPRLAIFRSNRFIYAQLIDDLAGHTLAAADSREVATADNGNKSDQAKLVGKMIAEKAKASSIETVVFDRGGYLYHGRVKALADGAREAGLKF
ncbi:MAG: 50S ribosomal protein L18 [Bacteroidota bacterium]